MPNQSLLKPLFFFTLFFITIFSITAQTPISGIVNEYYSVDGVNTTSNFVSVNVATNLSEGDRVLLIQMQGAIIDESNSSSFGTITNYSNAGNYEFHTVCSIDNNEVFFENSILNNYDTNQSVQLIFVPTYTSAIITNADLTGLAWDGSLGGVLVFEVDSTLDLNTFNINMSGKGFRGGEGSVSNEDCSWLSNVTGGYFQDYDNEPWARGLKGEGITKAIDGKECGIGPQANGGGGGNNHNGGGSGGGNYGAGGKGGERVPGSTFACNSADGEPSKELIAGYNSNKFFLGGGGGSGHGNNPGIEGEVGGNGGGIIIIRAQEIIVNNQNIISNGNIAEGSSNDGAAAGGAGGTIVLDVSNYNGDVTIEAQGGDGAGTLNTGASNCNGPGGGGGGGAILLTDSSLSTSITTSLSGGIAGTVLTTNQGNCTVGSNNNAENGNIGGVLFEINLQESDEISISCLPDCVSPEMPVLNFNEIDFCIGEEITLSVISGNLNGAEEWSWYSSDCGGDFISSGDELTLTPALSTTLFVTGTGGCLTLEETECNSINLVSHETYESSGTTTICEGEEVIFGGETINETGIYQLDLLSEFGCDSTIVLNLFITEIDNTIVETENTITAQQENAQYTWIDCDTDETIEGETEVSFSPLQSGTFSASVTVGSCTEISDCLDFVYVDDVNVFEINTASNLIVYPNPASEYIIIDMSSLSGDSRLVLYNVLGEQVLEIDLEFGQEIIVDIEALECGVYFGVVRSESDLSGFKFVKE